MQTETVTFQPSEWVPNNQTLPVLVYAEVFSGAEVTQNLERLFAENGWSGLWRNGVFDYQHYHTGAHEVLGIGCGSGKCRCALAIAWCCLRVRVIKTLDRRQISSSLGHIPPDRHADIQRAKPSSEQLDTIADVGLPSSDPVQGPSGLLTTAWRR